MAIDDYFTSIFCINLDRRTDRWAEAQAELASCGSSKCQRVSAVDARGYAGCTASHLGLWRRIAAGECGPRVLIFEDDFQLLTRPLLLAAGFGEGSPQLLAFDSCPGSTLTERFGAMQPHIPGEWDLLYLGGSLLIPPERVNRHVVKTYGVMTTHSYGVSKACAQKLVAFFADTYPQDDCAVAPDGVLHALAVSSLLQALCVYPRLFIQRNSSPSDLTPRPGGFPTDMVDTESATSAPAPAPAAPSTTQPPPNPLLRDFW